MNSEQTQGKWQQLKGAAREKWGKLTDDDLDQVRGKAEKLLGKVQEKYGVEKEEAKRQVDEFFSQNA
ncbi:MAG: CsbD family protein [Planctomycetes bacterium]|nr:CsbD family protein [Planctomycetota bacterium]